MIKKSDIVREAVREQDWKKALLVAKDFRIGVTQEQRSKMARAYECIVHPDFYRQIGVDIPEAIEQGKAIVKEYAESTRRKNTMMKWDVKGTQEEECKFFKIVRNTEEMRLQLMFDGKPEPEVREILKSNGFRWAPSQSAWQRHLNGNSEYSLKRVIEQLERLEAKE